ncbi:deoxyguanosinetriphosphate triphosphohydrolase [Nocardioides mesophilus]|uniref:Deoxyguanosinetriphosphate triphosphohydrolase-like protein n=1 Tax=Nocardioides mesophilus TaxID=433659 RepID=A0A7G9RCI8_9ACTN|nr:deoxyguanosinetriphosphate triphosphohydrolase [Nocardioides mesophilus]QNN53313.1 deoxyguanosinetriphosphate triphosphohydrolase [Nocardioides mesophilus]
MGSNQQYDEHARARWVDEPPKRPERTPFERDRARLVHSAALRRLAAKTQVVGPQSDDFVRNRLTHTLEVAQVARDLAKTLGCDPDIVETAALAHDLGHPPFGHNGERALDDVAGACGGFEGNAQTLRILTRLEAKTLDGAGRSVGLNLTRATLDASTKYPWPRARSEDPHGSHADGTARTVRKFGVYDDDLEVFTWLRRGADGQRRCLEAQVMDLSDDVAYSVHDLEDGVVAGRIDLARMADAGERTAVWATVRDWYLPGASDDALEEAWKTLSTAPAWPTRGYDGSRQSLAALKNLTSDLIGRFCTEVRLATRERYGAGPLARYAADLVVPEPTERAIAVLKGIAAHYVMRADERLPLLERQLTVVSDLVQRLLARGPAGLQPAYRLDFEAAADDAARLRVVVDQVASLTDASALAWHRRLE